jgi:hypothetical protein
MKVSGEFHASATLSPEKAPPVPIEWEAGWAPETVWTVCRLLQLLARGYTDWTIYKIKCANFSYSLCISRKQNAVAVGKFSVCFILFNKLLEIEVKVKLCFCLIKRNVMKAKEGMEI